MALSALPLALLVLVLAGPPAAEAARQRQLAASRANPIRKVVTLLQDIQTKVQEEGKRDEDLHSKYMCHCKNSGSDLTSSIEKARGEVASLTSSLEEAKEKKAQTSQDLKANQGSRSEAKDAIAEATALRQKESKAFAAEAAESRTNVEALAQAIAALEKGMSGAFLQTAAAQKIQKLAIDKAELPDETRQELVAFLSGKQAEGYVPQSQEIVGVLKQMRDEMAQGRADAASEEAGAKQSCEGLVAAKEKEVATVTKQIEEEMDRLGRLGVEIAEIGNDLEDTQESLAADTRFLAELEKGCATKGKEWEAVKQARADELVALSETIKVLNDDDALDMFKKTLPSAGASLLQVQVTAASLRARALAALHAAAARSSHLPARPELGLVALALRGKQRGFDKIVAMIDGMVAHLKTEQQDDDSKKEYCVQKFDKSDDKRKGLGVSLSDSKTAIEEIDGSIAKLTDDIASLEAIITSLDKSVADATEQRKAESKEFSQLLADSGTAKEVLLWAKNRLHKFYAPKLYKAPPKAELSEADAITVGFGGTLAPTPAPGGIAGTGIGAAFVQVSAHAQGKDAPPPAPETFTAYSKKTEASNGVIAMIDLLVKDLDKEITEATVEEKDAQSEYEGMLAEAQKKRAADAASLAEKGSAKAEEEQTLQSEKAKKVDLTKELQETLKYIHALHGECDWLLQYYDARKEARADEVDALGNAKAVLSGADYSLLQLDARRHEKARGFLVA